MRPHDMQPVSEALQAQLWALTAAAGCGSTMAAHTYAQVLWEQSNAQHDRRSAVDYVARCTRDVVVLWCVFDAGGHSSFDAFRYLSAACNDQASIWTLMIEPPQAFLLQESDNMAQLLALA